MKLSYKGINERVVTFLANGTIEPGDLVRVSSDNTVSVCEDNQIFDGVAVACRQGLCSVQVAGCAEVKLDEAIATGYKDISAGANGGIKAAVGGRMCTIINTDTTAGVATIIL